MIATADMSDMLAIGCASNIQSTHRLYEETIPWHMMRCMNLSNERLRTFSHC